MITEHAKDFLAITASVSTILQFLTGVLVCQKFVQKGSTGDASGFPFISAFLSCSMWLRYGFLIHDNSIILVNTFGASLQLGYIVTYYLYTVKKSIVTRQMVGGCLCMMIVLIYMQYEPDLEEARQTLGLICSMFTIVFFAAPLTVLAHVIRVKSTESLPFSLILANFVVSLQWFLYGVIIHDAFIQVTNALGTLLSAAQLSLFVIFRSDISISPVQIR